MLGDVVNVPYVEGLASFGAAVLFLWSYLMGTRPASPPLREIRDQAALTLTGHLRRAPDCATENALRGAFREFDRELILILADRTGRDHPQT
jgi:hypothetical protein